MATPPAAAPNWPEEALDASLTNLAAATFVLLLHPDLWVHRRVESFEFIDERTVRRRTSVDFTLPELCQPVDWIGQEVLLAPITLLRKRVLVDFDLRTEGGAALPLLTAGEGGRVAGEMLVNAARAHLDPDPLDSEVEKLLRAIPDPDIDRATHAHDQLFAADATAQHRSIAD